MQTSQIHSGRKWGYNHDPYSHHTFGNINFTHNLRELEVNNQIVKKQGFILEEQEADMVWLCAHTTTPIRIPQH